MNVLWWTVILVLCAGLAFMLYRRIHDHPSDRSINHDPCACELFAKNPCEEQDANDCQAGAVLRYAARQTYTVSAQLVIVELRHLCLLMSNDKRFGRLTCDIALADVLSTFELHFRVDDNTKQFVWTQETQRKIQDKLDSLTITVESMTDQDATLKLTFQPKGSGAAQQSTQVFLLKCETSPGAPDAA